MMDITRYYFQLLLEHFYAFLSTLTFGGVLGWAYREWVSARRHKENAEIAQEANANRQKANEIQEARFLYALRKDQFDLIYSHYSVLHRGLLRVALKAMATDKARLHEFWLDLDNSRRQLFDILMRKGEMTSRDHDLDNAVLQYVRALEELKNENMSLDSVDEIRKRALDLANEFIDRRNLFKR